MESNASNEGHDTLAAALAGRPILKDLNYPVVFKGMIDDWPNSGWTLQDWSQKFGQKKLQFRIGPVRQPPRSDPLWETSCSYIESTVEEFDGWQNGQIPKPPEADSNEININNATKFSDIDPDVYWAYADYKHMIALFPINDNIHNSLNWGQFGFPNHGGLDSTIWIGSPNCNTPCHYDTYGCNLVAQLIGKKRWILYPPSETDCLYPTRVPYEESSVFSSVNIDDPNMYQFPKFALASPYVITLEAGDVLFVPHKWWHFVKSLTTSLSINSWISMGIDNERRLEEAVTRTMLSSYMSAHSKDEGLQWLNPTEQEYTSLEINIEYVRAALKVLACLPNQTDTPETSQLQQNMEVEDSDSDSEPVPSDESIANVSRKRASKELLGHAKRPRTKPDEELEQILSQFSDQITVLKPMHYTDFIKEILLQKNVPHVPPIDMKQNLNSVGDEDEDDKFRINLLNALVDPEVVSLICKKLHDTYL